MCTEPVVLENISRPLTDMSKTITCSRGLKCPEKSSESPFQCNDNCPKLGNVCCLWDWTVSKQGGMSDFVTLSKTFLDILWTLLATVLSTTVKQNTRADTVKTSARADVGKRSTAGLFEDNNIDAPRILRQCWTKRFKPSNSWRSGRLKDIQKTWTIGEASLSKLSCNTALGR